MNRPKLPVLLALVAVAATGLACDASSAATDPSSAATVGEKAPAFTLPDLEGDEHSLSDYQGKVVVLEWINPNCPFSVRHAKEKTMTALAKDNPEVVWLAINSTRDGHGDYLQPDAHQAYNAEHGITYPVLYDVSGEVGHAYGAKTTPHMYLIDEEGTLIYEGAIDDDPAGRQRERTNYVAVGLSAHSAGQPVEPATTKPYGCAVKY